MRTMTMVLLLLVAVAAHAATAAVSPSVTVTPSRLTVAGVTHAAPVLFFGLGFEPKGSYAITHRWSTTATADADGIATYELNPPVNWDVLWIVADLRTGHYAIASTPGFPTLREHLARREFKRDVSGAISRFVYGRAEAQVLYLTPGGASTSTAFDGGTNDADGRADGSMEIDLQRFQVIAGDSPRAFAPGGTLFIIDPSRLDLLELKLDGSILAGAR